MKKVKKSKKEIERILRSITITKEESGNSDKGGVMKELFKMRYGKDWRKYYPLLTS